LLTLVVLLIEGDSLTLQYFRLFTQFFGPVGIEVETEGIEVGGQVTATEVQDVR
jgi:hypothetical protein